MIDELQGYEGYEGANKHKSYEAELPVSKEQSLSSDR